jgi:hypothetical protein
LDIDILKIANDIKVDLEMHDKLIVASALYSDSWLITKDRRIRESKVVKTIW